MKKTFQTLLLATLSTGALASDKAQITKTLEQYSGQELTVSHINKTVLPGINEVVVTGQFGQEVFYMSEDGQYMLEGKLLDVKNKVNLKTETENSLRKELMADHTKSLQTIDFYPDSMKDHITVFTDIDCGFCRKLHEEMDGYNDLGIGVSYVFFPRAGLQSESFDKAVNVWCAADQQKAMTAAKSGDLVEPKMCKNPITSQFNLGIQAGVHKVGTPSVVFADGSLIPGYLPPEAMKARLDALKK